MRRSVSVLVFAATANLASQAALADAGVGVSVGADYSTGEYGASTETEIWYYPLIMKYESDVLTLKLTVPYIKITGPSNVVGGTAGEPIQLSQQTGARRSESGLGDVVATATYNVFENRGAGLLIDLTGKIKFATADDEKDLGTGENDYAVQTDITKSFGAPAVFGTIGWKKLGDPPGVTLKDPWYASLGAAHKIASPTTVGLSYDYRQRVVNGGSHISEITAFVTHKLTTATKLQGYAIKGLSDGSPDWGAGLLIGTGF